MERVAFLIEETGERIGCLLNPDSLVIRRSAGVQPRRSAGDSCPARAWVTIHCCLRAVAEPSWRSICCLTFR